MEFMSADIEVAESTRRNLGRVPLHAVPARLKEVAGEVAYNPDKVTLEVDPRTGWAIPTVTFDRFYDGALSSSDKRLYHQLANMLALRVDSELTGGVSLPKGQSIREYFIYDVSQKDLFRRVVGMRAASAQQLPEAVRGLKPPLRYVAQRGIAALETFCNDVVVRGSEIDDQL